MKEAADQHLLQNRVAWEAVNSRFNLLKGNFAEAIQNGMKVIPDEILKSLRINTGDRLLHPMCNDGREAAYLSRKLGCQVVGVDFSPSAIGFATALNTSLSLANKFVEAEISDWMTNQPPSSFDGVVLTPGSLWWIPNLTKFYELVRRLLRMNGTLAIWDFHPITTCIDDDQHIFRSYPFDRLALTHKSGLTDYIMDPNRFRLVDRIADFIPVADTKDAVTDFRWSMAALLDSLFAKNRFALEYIQELEFIWEERYFRWLIESEFRRYEPAPGVPRIPLTFVIRAGAIR